MADDSGAYGANGGSGNGGYQHLDPDDLTFGRVEQFDDRSLAYGLAEHLDRQYGADAPRQPRTHLWDVPDPAPLNQGQTAECVAYTWTHDAIAAPVLVPNLTGSDAHRWFRRMKQIDRLGIPASQGTSVIAGAKTMVEAGHISAYRWAMNPTELALGVAFEGPGIIGIPWTEGMMRPDQRGFLRPTGRSVGGHAVLVIGYDATDRFFYILSSWGKRFGKNGRAKISFDTMADRLGGRRGEACFPTRIDPAAPSATTAR